MKVPKLFQAVKYENLKDMMEKVTAKYADNKAFVIKHKEGKNVSYEEVTYTQVGEQMHHLGTAFLQRGFAGKRVAIISKNRYDWILTYVAVINGVGVTVPLDKDLPAQEMHSLLQRSKADAIVFESKYLQDVYRFYQEKSTNLQLLVCMDALTEEQKATYPDVVALKELLAEGKALWENGEKSYADAKIDAEALATIIFTSGTTSLSKAVMLSHKNLVSNLYDLGRTEKIYETDVNMAFLPYHHTFGSTGQLFFLYSGACSCYCDGLRHIQENLREYKVSVFVCVPLLLEAMYKKIMVQVEKQGKTKLIQTMTKVCNALLKVGIDIRRVVFKQILDPLGGKLRFAISGASAIDGEVVKGFNNFGILCVQGYGLTETAPVLSAEREGLIRYGSIGFPLPSVEIKIDDPDENGIGEITAKGPNVMLGYYENEEATKEVLQDGWFHTGDLGYFDKDGFLFVNGRKKNVIVLKNGKKVFPEEMELLINNLPYVAESMVFGWPVEDDVEVSVKIVYNKEYTDREFAGYSQEQLKEMIWKDIKEINRSLAKYKYMKNLVITDQPMIKTSTAKIKRHEEMKTISI